MLSYVSRSLGVALAGIVLLTSAQIRPASASSALNSSPTIERVGDTDFSSRRRYYGHHRGGNAAAFALFAITAGTIAAIASERHYRKRYYQPHYGYYGSPYGYQSAYYAPQHYYRPHYGYRHYRPHYFARHHYRPHFGRHHFRRHRW